MKLFFKNLVFYSFIPFFIFSCNSSQEKQEDIVHRIPDPKTLNEIYVSDPDHILQPSTINLLNSQLRELDMSEKAHIDVVLVNSIGDQVPKDIAYKLFNRWKIGRADTNNGLLIFLVLDQRRVEFETGLGLESVLTDMICGSIQRTYMIPYLKQGNYDKAVLVAVSKTIEVLDTGHYNFDDDTTYIDKNLSKYDLDNSQKSDNQSIYDQNEALIKLPKRYSYSFINFISNNSSFLSKFIPVLLVIIVIFSNTKKRKGFLAYSFWLLGIIIVFLTIPITIGYIALAHYNLIEIVYFLLILNFIVGLPFQIKYIKLLYAIPKKSRTKNYDYLDKHKRGLKICIWLFPISFNYFIYKKLCNDMKKYRYEPYRCEKCHKPMVLEKERNLSKGELIEEEIKSVEHDVWLCSSCNLETIIKYPNIHSKVEKCKKCHFITAVAKNKIVVKNATTSSSGWGYTVYICKFCQSEHKEKYTISRKSSGSSGSYSGRRSSSSSSSGGRSGGGGSGSSW